MLVVWRKQREKAWLLTESSARRCSQQHGYSINTHHAIKIFNLLKICLALKVSPITLALFIRRIATASPLPRRPGGRSVGVPSLPRAARGGHPRGTATSPERAPAAARRPGTGRAPPAALSRETRARADPESIRRTPQHPRGGAGTAPPAQQRRRRLAPRVALAMPGAPQTWGRPGHPAGCPGEGARPGRQRQFRSKGRGWRADEPRREFGGGPAPLAAPLLSWRRRLRRRRWPVPSRPALNPGAGPTSGRVLRDPRSPARRYLRGHGARAASPTRERNSPARRAPSRSGRRGRGRGGCASGNIPAAHWPPPRSAPLRPRPQGHPCMSIGWGRDDARWARPGGRSRALTRGGRGAGAGRSSFVPNSAPRARAGSGGLRAAFPVRARPLCPGGGRSPAHLAGREAGGGSAEPGSAGPPGTGTGEPRVPRPRVLSQRRGSCGGGRARSENPPGKKIQRRWGGGGDGCRGLAAWDG